MQRALCLGRRLPSWTIGDCGIGFEGKCFLDRFVADTGEGERSLADGTGKFQRPALREALGPTVDFKRRVFPLIEGPIENDCCLTRLSPDDESCEQGQDSDSARDDHDESLLLGPLALPDLLL